MTHDSFSEHCRDVARRFLLTAVVVDDELSVSADAQVHGDLTRPDRHTARRAPPSTDPPTPRPLKIEPVTRSFADEGMVCGIVSPKQGDTDHVALAKAVAGADIVILDWRLNRATGENALPLLDRILTEDPRNRLRLIAFYTDEPDLRAIRRKVAASLTNHSEPGQPVTASSDGNEAIDVGPCRILVYAKPDSRTPDRGFIVAEEALASRLIADFANRVEGLLPALVLTALAAVRENEYRLLERFGRSLDPAFLAHRASLPQPPEAAEHMVEQMASELYGVMADAVSRRKPAGIDPIKLWLAGRFGSEGVVFGPNKEMSLPDVLEMLAHGVEKKPGQLRAAGKDYDILSRGFAGGDSDGGELDRRLASVMSFRLVPEGYRPQLSMGTVVRPVGADTDATLLCVTPKCDSVRLKERSSFLFIPLSDPRPYTSQLVVPTQDSQHRRMTISLNPAQWQSVVFEPGPERECVVAAGRESSEAFTFKDVDGEEYRWVGELKAESAQSIAQAIAERMSRIPLNKSEWLRRSERLGKRAG